MFVCDSKLNCLFYKIDQIRNQRDGEEEKKDKETDYLTKLQWVPGNLYDIKIKPFYHKEKQCLVILSESESDSLLQILDITENSMKIKASIKINHQASSYAIFVKRNTSKVYIIPANIKARSSGGGWNGTIYDLITHSTQEVQAIVSDRDWWFRPYLDWNVMDQNNQIHILMPPANPWLGVEHLILDIDNYRIQAMTKFNSAKINRIHPIPKLFVYMKHLHQMVCISGDIDGEIWNFDMNQHQPEWKLMNGRTPNKRIGVLIESEYILFCLCYDGSIACWNLFNNKWYHSQRTCNELCLNSNNFIKTGVFQWHYYDTSIKVFCKMDLLKICPLNLRDSMKFVVFGYVRNNYKRNSVPTVIRNLIGKFLSMFFSK